MVMLRKLRVTILAASPATIGEHNFRIETLIATVLEVRILRFSFFSKHVAMIFECEVFQITYKNSSFFSFNPSFSM